MLRWLASRLKEKLPAAWKATRKREDELEWRAKETAISREIMPADGSSNPAQRNERGLRHVPALRRATLRRVSSLSLTDGRGKE
jgi:hypothetical protein